MWVEVFWQGDWYSAWARSNVTVTSGEPIEAQLSDDAPYRSFDQWRFNAPGNSKSRLKNTARKANMRRQPKLPRTAMEDPFKKGDLTGKDGTVNDDEVEPDLRVSESRLMDAPSEGDMTAPQSFQQENGGTIQPEDEVTLHLQPTASSRVRKVRLARPNYVPKQLLSIWAGAARTAAIKGKLFTGLTLDENAVRHEYKKLLGSYRRLAEIEQ